MNEELVQISKFIPEVKDRYYINRKGELFTDNGEKKMKDCVKNGYVKNSLALKDGTARAFFDIDQYLDVSTLILIMRIYKEIILMEIN